MSRLRAEGGAAVVIEIGRPTTVGPDTCCLVLVDDCMFVHCGIDGLDALYGAAVQAEQMLQRRPATGDIGELAFVDPRPGTDTVATSPVTWDALAERTIEHHGQRHRVTVGRPFPSPTDSRVVLCPIQIDDRPLAMAGGREGIHALLTAIRMTACWFDLPPDWPSTRTT